MMLVLRAGMSACNRDVQEVSLKHSLCTAELHPSSHLAKSLHLVTGSRKNGEIPSGGGLRKAECGEMC